MTNFLKAALLCILLLLPGCGAGSPGAALEQAVDGAIADVTGQEQPTNTPIVFQVINGASYPYGQGYCPAPRPGVPPSEIPQTIIRCINTSAWPNAAFLQALSDVNAQLQAVGTYWGINCALVQYSEFLSAFPSEWISGNLNPPGLAADGKTAVFPGEETRGGSGFLCYTTVVAESNSGSVENYFSHGVLKVASGGATGALISQGTPSLDIEAQGYGIDAHGNPSTAADVVQNLDDWLFPPGGNYSPVTGAWSYDFAGYYPIADPDHPPIAPAQ